LDPDGIQTMIDEAVAVRRVKVEENRDLLVELRPEFANALQHCNTFSSMLLFNLIFHSLER